MSKQPWCLKFFSHFLTTFNQMKQIFILALVLGVSLQNELYFGQIYDGALTIDQKYEGNLHYDRFHVQLNDTIGKDDTIVIAKGEGPLDDPDIFISFKDELSADAAKADIKCNKWGTDVCTIPKNESLIEFWIGIGCSKSCQYQLRVMQVRNKIMSINDSLSMKYDFYHNNSIAAKIVTIMTPEDIVELETLNIMVQMNGIFIKHDGFHVYLSEAPKVPNSVEYDVRGKDVFFGTKLIELSQTPSLSDSNGLTFKPSTSYNVLIDAPTESVIDVTTYCTGKVRSIKLFERVVDLVGAGETKDYIFRFKDDLSKDGKIEDYSLIFSLVPFSGNPNLYVNVKKQPLRLSEYRWRSNDTQSSEYLVITRQELEEMGIKQKKEVYYITVTGTIASAYVLQIYQEKTQEMYLDFNLPMKSRLEQGYMMTYYLVLWGEQEYTVNIDLYETVGQVQLLSRLCDIDFLEECAFETKEIPKLIKNKELLSDSSHGHKQIKFPYKPSECNTEGPLEVQDEGADFSLDAYCVLLISVYANKQLTFSNKLNHFTLVVTHTNVHIDLQETVPSEAVVELGDILYFQFIVPYTDTTVKRVQFQINHLQGRTEMMTSKTNKYPSDTDRDLDSVFNAVTYSVEDYPDLTGPYYIAVKGQTESVFYLSAIVSREGEEKDNTQYTYLVQGLPQSYLLNRTDDRMYFVVSVPSNGNFDDNQTEINTNPILRFQFQAIRGQFETYIKKNIDNGPPSSQDYDYQLFDNLKLTVPQGQAQDFYIVVEPVFYDDQNNTNQYMFEIYYQMSNDVSKLVINEAEYAEIQLGETLHYKAKLHKGKEYNLFQYSWDDNAHLTTYVSLSQRNENPGPKQFTHILKGQDQLNITQELLHSYCSFLEEPANHEKCHIYMTLTSTNTTWFQLSLETNEYLYTLYDGVPVHIKFPGDQNQPVFMSYIIPTNSSVKVYEYNYVMSSAIYANLEQFSNELDKTQFKYPTKEQYMLSSIQTNYQSLNTFTISETVLNEKKCFDTRATCVLTMAFYPKYPEGMLPDPSYGFYIQVSSSVTRIQIGYPQIGENKANQMNYFRFYNNQEKNILISITMLSGYQGAILYVSGEKSLLPDQNNYEFSSVSMYDPEILIEKGSSDSTQKSTIGTYNIGVFSYSDIMYSLQVTVGDYKLYHLIPQYPTKGMLRRNEVGYFIYRQYYPQQFNIIFSTLSSVKVYECQAYQSLTSFLDTSENDNSVIKLANSKQTLQQTITPTNSSENSSEITFVIVVQTLNTNKEYNEVSVTVEIQGSQIMLENDKTLKHFLSKDQIRTYAYFDNGHSELKVFMLYGKVNIYIGYDEQPTVEKNSLSQLCDKSCSFPVQGNNDTFYDFQALFVAPEDCFYTIQVNGNKYIQTVDFGYPLEYLIQPEDKMEFRVNNVNDTKETQFQVSVQVLKTLQHNLMDEIFPTVTIINRNKTLSPNGVEAYIKSVQKMDNHRIYTVDDTPGEYSIIIANDRQKVKDLQLPQNILVSVNKNSLQLVLPGVYTLHQIPVGKVYGFQLYQAQAKKIFVEVLQCSGLVKVFATQSLDNFKQGVSELEVNRKQSELQQALFTMKSDGVVYIGIKAIQGNFESQLSKHNSLFKVKSTIYSLSQRVPFENFVAGENGISSWKLDGDHFVVSFSKVQTLEAMPDLTPTAFVYKLIFLDENNNLCSNTTYAAQQYLHADKHQYVDEVTFNVPVHLTSNYESIRYVVHCEVLLKDLLSAEETITVYYETEQIPQYQQFYGRHQRRHRRWYIGAIFMTAFVALIVAVLYLWRRLRQYQARLKYELSDVRNVAQLDSLRDKPIENELEMNYRGMQEAASENL